MQVNAAASSAIYSVELIPLGGQNCTAQVSGTAKLLDDAGKLVKAVGNPVSATYTVAFVKGVTPPTIGWDWGPRCSDSGSITISITVGAHSVSTREPTLPSCAAFGGITYLRPVDSNNAYVSPKASGS